MTNDEAIAIIRNEYKCVDRDCDIERSCGKCDLMMPSKEPILEAYKLAIKALEQQPCEDEYIKVPKKALKYRTAGMVAYNAEWLKKHWQMELKVMGIECDDAISREAVYSILNEHHIDEDRIKSDMDERQNLTVNSIASDVSLLPSVTQKHGKWIRVTDKSGHLVWECNKCGWQQRLNTNFCPDCGSYNGGNDNGNE